MPFVLSVFSAVLEHQLVPNLLMWHVLHTTVLVAMLWVTAEALLDHIFFWLHTTVQICRGPIVRTAQSEAIRNCSMGWRR